MIHKDWDINEHNTGRFNNGKPIIGVTLQNGLNDIEPDGSFVPCDMTVEAAAVGVTTHKVKRGRYGELRFSDSASINKHLCKIKYRDDTGRSIKYIDADSGLPDVANGKPKFEADNGISIEHTPLYNGVKIELIIADPLTAPLEYNFSVKDYGQAYTDALVGEAIISTGEDGKTVIFHPPYAEDANGDIGQVDYVLLDKVDGLTRFKKVVDETWLRQAAAPVKIDPIITIEDGVDGGVIDDNLMVSGTPNNNYGAYHDGIVNATQAFVSLMKVDLSAIAGVTPLSAHFGIDLYQVVGAGAGSLLWYQTLKFWNAGTKVGTAATTGESTWNSARHGELLWASGGCRGAGTDRAAVADGSKVPFINSDFQLPISLALAQIGIDDGELPIVIESSNSNTKSWRSTEATLGNKPYFYIEYIEPVIFNASWARNSNQIIGMPQ